MPAMETDPLPPGWDPADPATWRYVAEVAVALPSPGRDPDDPIVGRREIVTAATEHGRADDPALGLGMLPGRAAAWWADVLGPIHLARVAAVGYRAATEDLVGGAPPPWEAGGEDGPIDIGNPLLPGLLESRSAAALAFLDALGLPSPRRRG
ncbi:MAG: Butyryl-CoA dehydrogenase [uncultured Thermomicrobiales bacterium]|uniref:Butyryl-CoA dehydrogenase n=1 Tax=uncultured Thermomicrobiales bacterium TaxID=1645740 RepID=A0A6J4VFL4_9BACT|nr:MAG: Butyryl-CoA dehydrogenase [uncultured Thermomicrobiales bacterium]